jgi:hypothetical protein
MYFQSIVKNIVKVNKLTPFLQFKSEKNLNQKYFSQGITPTRNVWYIF